MNRVRSIRSMLTSSLLTGLVMLSAFIAAGIYYTTRHALIKQFDAAMFSKARALATLVQEDVEGIEFDFADEMMPSFSRKQEPEYFQIWMSGGATLEKSPSLENANLPHPHRLQSADHASGNLKLPDGREGRSVALTFIPHNDDSSVKNAASRGNATVVVAQGRGPLDDVLRSLVLILLFSLLFMCGGSVALVLYTVQRGLRPIEVLAEKVAAIGPANLHERFDPGSAPNELKPIHARLNDLLVRLHSAFERERRFTRDASHELRTPLAEMKTVLEVAERWPDDTVLQKSSFHEAQLALDNMQQLIAKLLVLAKSEGNAIVVAKVPVDLGSLTRKICATIEDTAREQAVTIDLTGLEQIVVPADEQLLSGVLRNLIENAISHSPLNSLVTIHVHRVAANVEWHISNPAPALTAEDVIAMFDPFWRKDASRTDQSHNGLGLSILKAFCDLSGIRVQAGLNAEQILTITLVIPKE